MAARNVPPEVWGATAWRVLHGVAACVRSRADYAHARALFAALQQLLPCARCRANYGEHLQRAPFPASPRGIPRWVFELHQQVNGRLRKTNCPTSWTQVRMKNKRCSRALAELLPQAFVDALAASHPGRGARGVPRAFLEAHLAFWAALRHFYADAPEVRAADVETRTAFRQAVGATGRASSICTTACHI